MKTRAFSIITLCALVLAGLAILLSTGCARKTDCIAKITCIDANGRPASGVTVNLFAYVKHNIKADLTALGVTDSQGQVSFTFKLPAIYDVKAMLGKDSASSIISLEPGQISEKKLQLQ